MTTGSTGMGLLAVIDELKTVSAIEAYVPAREGLLASVDCATLTHAMGDLGRGVSFIEHWGHATKSQRMHDRMLQLSPSDH
jgi:hypothetical protein